MFDDFEIKKENNKSSMFDDFLLNLEQPNNQTDESPNNICDDYTEHIAVDDTIPQKLYSDSGKFLGMGWNYKDEFVYDVSNSFSIKVFPSDIISEISGDTPNESIDDFNGRQFFNIVDCESWTYSNHWNKDNLLTYPEDGTVDVQLKPSMDGKELLSDIKNFRGDILYNYNFGSSTDGRIIINKDTTPLLIPGIYYILTYIISDSHVESRQISSYYIIVSESLDVKRYKIICENERCNSSCKNNIIFDNTISKNTTWSSHKINEELSKKCIWTDTQEPVGFYALSYNAYNQLSSKDNSVLYFITDKKQVYKGNINVTSMVELVGGFDSPGGISLSSAIEGKLYVTETKGSKNKGCRTKFNGQWVEIIPGYYTDGANWAEADSNMFATIGLINKQIVSVLDNKVTSMGNGVADVVVLANSDGGIHRSDVFIGDDNLSFDDKRKLATEDAVKNVLSWKEL